MCHLLMQCIIIFIHRIQNSENIFFSKTCVNLYLINNNLTLSNYPGKLSFLDHFCKFLIKTFQNEKMILNNCLYKNTILQYHINKKYCTTFYCIWHVLKYMYYLIYLKKIKKNKKPHKNKKTMNLWQVIIKWCIV